MDVDFIRQIDEAILLGEGYAVIQLDPDGFRVTPVIAEDVNDAIRLRGIVRYITRSARSVWRQGRPLVAAAQAGGEDQLPSSVSPSGPASTSSFLETRNDHFLAQG